MGQSVKNKIIWFIVLFGCIALAILNIVVNWLAIMDFFVKRYGDFPAGWPNWMYNICFFAFNVACIGVITGIVNLTEEAQVGE